MLTAKTNGFHAKSWWMGLPLLWKVFFVVAFPSLALVVIILAVVFTDHQRNAANEWVRHSFVVRSQIARAQLAAARSGAFASQYVFARLPDSIFRSQDELAQLGTSIQNVCWLVQDNSSQSARCAAASATLDQFRSALTGFLNRGERAPQASSDVAELLSGVEISLNRLGRQLEAMKDVEDLLLEQRERQSSQVRARVQWLMMLCLFFGLAGGFFSLFVLRRGIVTRLLAIHENLDRLESGKMLNPADECPDELGHLSRGVEKAADLLRERSYAFENALDGIARFDAAGFATFANQAFATLLGRSVNQVLGSERGFAVIEPDMPAFLAAYDQMRNTGKADAVVRMAKLDGTTLFLHVTLVRIADKTGAFAGNYSFLKDVTARIRAEEALQKAKEEAEGASKAKSEFLARMSHEIRTPMNAILGMADLLWESELSNQEREYVRIFRASANRLISLINDVLDLSKIEAGQLGFETIPFSLTDVVSQPVDLLRTKAVQKGIALTYEIDRGLPTHVIGDPQRLQQVLVNLIGNAVKFTDRGRVTLCISVDRQTDSASTLHFAVSDTGPGISPEKIDSIFDSFSQADTSITRKHGGTGLGLAISRRIVDMMGGHIWAESEPGKGSCFHFTATLPIWSPAAESISVRRKIEGLHALIVDDDSTNRLMLREALVRWGVHAMEAADAESALEHLRKAEATGTAFDLILLDRHLGSTNGFDLAHRIQEECAEIPAIALLTSDRNPGDFSRAQALGIRAILEKPFERGRLLDTIEEALRFEVPPPQHHPENDSTRRKRVLLAEDSEANIVVIKAYLSAEPIDLEVVENGRLAVERYKSEPYDLIFMDIQMPEMDGYSATCEIRRWEREQSRAPIPILALTAHALQDEVAKSIEAGCTAHLTKPVRRKTLLDALHRHLRHAAAVRV